MKRLTTIAVMLLACCSLLLAQAEDTDETQEIQETESSFNYRIFRMGDNLLELNVALSLPAKANSGLKLGGSGTIAYDRLITDNISLGGEISFNYATTIGRNVFYFIPILFRTSWHYCLGNLELDATMGLGCCFENYLDRTYFGLAIEPQAGIFYKFFADWSAGVSGGLYILPQWYKDSSKNATGLVADIRVGVKHIF